MRQRKEMRKTVNMEPTFQEQYVHVCSLNF
jgi:hypothetical protein